MSNVDFNFSNFDFDALEQSAREAATPTKTPAEILAEQNAARLGEVAGAADVAGSFVTGEEQARVDEILAGVQSGKYSAGDALGALSAIETVGRARTGDGTSDGTGDGTSTEDRAKAQSRTDAFSRLRVLLSRVGLSELEGAVQGIITGGTVDLSDSDAILFALRDQPAYQKRFAANAARAKKGLPELDPSTYVSLEESYRQLMRSNGLPLGFFDEASDFQTLIEGDVSPMELQNRIEQGYAKVRDADPEVKRQMQQLYGVDDTALTAYFLDPQKAAPLLTRQARAAQIAARGKEQAGLQLTAETAESLAARGITPEEAQQRFAERGALEGLYQPIYGEEKLTEEQMLGATFGYDVKAQQELMKRQRQRLAEFQGGGQFARTTGATSGTTETGVGMAQ